MQSVTGNGIILKIAQWMMSLIKTIFRHEHNANIT